MAQKDDIAVIHQDLNRVGTPRECAGRSALVLVRRISRVVVEIRLIDGVVEVEVAI